MMTHSMHALVTGGAGFIGSHLVDRLLRDGHRVTVIDDFSNGKRSNLDDAAREWGLDVKKANVADFDEIAPYFEGVDWVFHLAAKADIVPSIREPSLYHRVNVDGTVAVLEAARVSGAKRFVYASSSSCYGLAQQLPTPETAVIAPMYPYAFTKHVAEQYVLHWGMVYGLPSVSLRLFNVYGPRSRTSGAYGAVFGVFLAQKLAGVPLTVVGDGNQTRDFTFVTDVAAAFVTAAESDVAGEVFNVGSGGTYSVNRLAGLLGGETIHLPKRPGEPDCTFADITKIRLALGWEPTVSFEQGVATILEDIGQWSDAPVWNESSIADATREWFEYMSDSRVASPSADERIA